MVRVMEVRKVMRLGMSSLVVSVPKEWAERYHLSGESRLVLIPQPDGSIALYPESVPREKPRAITLTTSPKDPQGLLERRMVAAYLTDFDEICIQSDNVIEADKRNRIRQYLRLLNGYQIMETSANHLLIQKVARLAEMDVERALHRLHTIAVSMLKDSLIALEKRDITLAETVTNLTEETSQFNYLINKQLRLALLDPNILSRSGLTSIDTINYSTALHAIKQASESAKGIANAVITLADHDCPPDILKLALENGQLVLSLFTDSLKAFFTRNDKLANSIINQGKACPPMRAQAEKLMEQHLIQICEKMIPTISAEACSLFGFRQVALTVLEQVFQSLSQIGVAAATIAQHAIWRVMETQFPTEPGSPKPPAPRKAKQKRKRASKS